MEATEQTEIRIQTQAELDAVGLDFNGTIIICVENGFFTHVDIGSEPFSGEGN